LNIKNEVVIKKGLFLAKKRYALNIISREHNPIDEILVMGLEIKRSDYPSMTKNKLKELLDILLKKDFGISKTLDYIKKTEIEFIDEIQKGNKETARPVSYTKKLEQYKVLTMSIKGMENWNKLEYKTFGVGSRGYLFKINGIDLDKAPTNIVESYNQLGIDFRTKLKEIVVPEEILNLPNYYIIDWKEMLKFAWTDRWKLLLDPLIKLDENKILTF
jgi:hypothetical protein